MECEDGVCELPMTREDKVADYLWARGLLNNTTTVKEATLPNMLSAAHSLRLVYSDLCDLMLMVGATHHAKQKAEDTLYQDLIRQMAVAQLTLSEVAVVMNVNLEEASDRVHKALLASAPPDKEYVAPDLSDLLS